MGEGVLCHRLTKSGESVVTDPVVLSLSLSHHVYLPITVLGLPYTRNSIPLLENERPREHMQQIRNIEGVSPIGKSTHGPGVVMLDLASSMTLLKTW